MSDSADGPIPFFGIGAMRAGTSWLWDVLKRYPDCHISPLKELHFFDSRYGVATGHWILTAKAQELVMNATKIHDAISVLREELRDAPRANLSECLDDPDAPLYQNDEFRRDLYHRLGITQRTRKIAKILQFFSIQDLPSYVAFLKHEAAGASAFGEITPSYALLPAAAFAEIDSAFPGARFIFILRDPVDRLWSHVRYARARKHKKRRLQEADLNAAFRRALELPSYVARSCYSRTIQTLESKIPQERILYLFHETMVSLDTGPGEIRRIETFLNLQPRDPEGLFQESRNAAPAFDLDPENRAAALNLFRPEYDFVARRFGAQEKWLCPD